MHARPAAPARPDGGAFVLPCACANLRRLTRLVTRLYDLELRASGLEITQLGLLAILNTLGEATHKRLAAGLAIDSTTLTRTLGLLRRRGWVDGRAGPDRRERVYRLTAPGRARLRRARPGWERAQARLHGIIGDAQWLTLLEATTSATARLAAGTTPDS
ncbi:MAG: winged helix-turn-helix transcriptional regulator [Acidobacteria bacterium]|nr:winged helix-turn-helix transcriptional regulator [Acidobacteriota bacterium]